MVEHLSPEEVSFFVREGYLVKPAALDPRRIDAARQHWWSHNRVGRLRPDEPATWLGGFRDDELCEDPSNAVSRLSWDCRMVGGDEPLLDLLPRACWGAVTQLLGTDLVIPEGRTKPGSNFAHPGANIAGVGSPGQACRGVYCSMPEPLTPAERAAIPPLPERSSGHCDGWDGTRWRLSLSTTLDDVPPGGGALCLWPRSHRRLYPLRHLRIVSEAESRARASDVAQRRFGNQSDLPDVAIGNGDVVQEIRDGEFAAELARVNEDTRPVECCGPAGTVIFWHPRGCINLTFSHCEPREMLVVRELLVACV